MRILILNNSSIDRRPFHVWLAGHELVLLQAADGLSAEEQRQIGENYLEAVFLPGYAFNLSKELVMDGLHARYRFDRVAVTSEFDIEIAARMRRRWKISGQTVGSSLQFRDKYMMKSVLSVRGIAVPAMSALDGLADILDFIDQVGYPVVIKPKRFSGSVAVGIIRTADDILPYLGSVQKYNLGISDLMVEEFNPGQLFHVDGLFIGKRILHAWTCRYLSYQGTLDEDSIDGGVMLDADSKLKATLEAFAGKVITALDGPVEASSFHAEIFHSETAGAQLCEIACRTGGGGINEMHQHAFGINLVAESIRGQCGLELSARKVTVPVPHGYLLIPGRSMKLVSHPGSCPLPGVSGFVFSGVPGTVYGGKKNSSDNIGNVYFAGCDEKALESKALEIKSWMEASITWQEA